MTASAQARATTSYRARLADRGVVRFELQTLEADRDLMRALARKLGENGAEADRLRQALKDAVEAKPSGTKGNILAALRRSPLVGVDLDLTRSRSPGRKIDL